VVVALALPMGGPARAAEPGVSLQGGWMRMTIAARPAGGYFTLTNSGARDRTLTGAASPACGKVMLHRSEHGGGTERMVMVPKVRVPAHGVLRFAPGGYHLMCMQPAPAMRAGARVPMTLHFADGGSLSAPFLVKGAAGR
jgi:copper(I)-binding protein